jgi:hypothetical protein
MSSSAKPSPFAESPETANLQPGRREQTLSKIQAALLETHLTFADDGKRGGFDPYNSGGGRTRREVWKPRRR